MKKWIQENERTIFEKIVSIYKILAIIVGVIMILKILGVLGVGILSTVFSLGLLLPLAGIMAIIAIPLILLSSGIRIYLYWKSSLYADRHPKHDDSLKLYVGILLVFALIGLVFSGDSSMRKTLSLLEILLHGFVLYAISVARGEGTPEEEDYRRPLD